MSQPLQPWSAAGAAWSQPPLEVTVVSDAQTTARLSRALSLTRWRSPSTWVLLFAIPLIVLVRRVAAVFIATTSQPWDWPGLLVSYVLILGFTAVIVAAITLIQLIKRNPVIAAYTSPGSAISVRFHQDSLDLALPTGTTNIPYSQIKGLVAIGGGMYLRVKGTRGLMLPRALFPEAAQAIIGNSPTGSAPRTPAAPLRKGRRALIIAGMVAVLAAVSTAVVGYRIVEERKNATGNLPDPCVLTNVQLAELGLTNQRGPIMVQGNRVCSWGVQDPVANGSAYGTSTVSVRPTRDPGESSDQPYRVGTSTTGVEAREHSYVARDNSDADCRVSWSSPYGSTYVEMDLHDRTGVVDVKAVCRRTEIFANAIFMKLPH